MVCYIKTWPIWLNLLMKILTMEIIHDDVTFWMFVTPFPPERCMATEVFQGRWYWAFLSDIVISSMWTRERALLRGSPILPPLANFPYSSIHRCTGITGTRRIVSRIPTYTNLIWQWWMNDGWSMKTAFMIFPRKGECPFRSLFPTQFPVSL